MIDGIPSLDTSFPPAAPLPLAPAVPPIIGDGSPHRSVPPAVSSRTPPPPEAIVRFRAAMAEAAGSPHPDSAPARLVKADAIASNRASAKKVPPPPHPPPPPPL